MAKHWSTGVFVLAWRDPRSNGRARLSWGDREWCERLAANMTDEHDAVLYNGFGAKVQIRPTDAPLALLEKPARKGKAKKKKTEPQTAA